MGKRPDMSKRMGRGADIFFENTSALGISKDNTDDTDKDNVKDTNKDTTKNTSNGNEKNSNNDTTQDTTQSTDKNTINSTNKHTNKHTNNNTINNTIQYTNKYTIEMPDTSELYNERLVANVTRSQKKYVEQTAKKHKLNNSEFVRFMIDFFIDNFEIK